MAQPIDDYETFADYLADMESWGLLDDDGEYFPEEDDTCPRCGGFNDHDPRCPVAPEMLKPITDAVRE